MTGRHDAVPPAPAALTPAWPDRAAWGTAQSLRAWQSAALEKYFARPTRDVMIFTRSRERAASVPAVV